MVKDKTIFITGGAGFISSHLIEQLINDNKIIVYDNFARNSISYLGIDSHPNLRIVNGDVLDLDLLKRESVGADIIIHCAAIAGIFSVGNKIATTMKVNLIGSYNVFETAVCNGIARVIDFSTSEVYGTFVYRGKEDNNTIIGPVGEKRWVYAISKLASEHFAHAYSQEHNLDITTVRPFNVYGPRQIGEGAVQQMIQKAIAGDDIIVYNDGVQIRAWCYITDFVDAICQIIDIPRSINQTFNIGNPQTAITVLGLAKLIKKLTNSSSLIVFRTHPGAEIEIRIPDISKATNLLNFNPVVGLTAGLEETIRWFTQNK